MAVDLLEKIIKNTAHKTSFQIIVSGNKSSILNPTLQLDRDKEYEIALVNLKTSKPIIRFQTSMRPTTCSFIPRIKTVIRG